MAAINVISILQQMMLYKIDAVCDKYNGDAVRC